jgi:hypothetical protein
MDITGSQATAILSALVMGAIGFVLIVPLKAR